MMTKENTDNEFAKAQSMISELCETIVKKSNEVMAHEIEQSVSMDMMTRQEQDIYTLLHCLFEEFTSNGGHFSSSDTHIMFTQRFCDWGESPQDAFKRLIRKKATQATQDT